MVKENKFIFYFKGLFKKYKEIKHNIINDKVGKKLFFITKIIILITFFLVIPILFTLISTLAGNGIIPMVVWEVIKWSILSILIVLLFVLIFFNEFNK